MALPRTDKEALSRVVAPIYTLPFRGGAVTVREIALIPLGGFSMIQNMRDIHPGKIKRKGCDKKHGNPDSTNKVLSLHQFSKGKRTENHFFAQMSDGDILEATSNPPVIDAGVFGSEVFDGSADQIPASWANLNDLLIHSNGVDQHKIYAGTQNYVQKLIKFDGSAAPPAIPVDGIDYTQEATDGLTTTFVVLDALNTYAAFETVFVCTPVPANRLTPAISTANTNSSVLTVRYKKTDNTWASASAADGSSAGGKSLATTGGAITWTHPTDEIPYYMYGVSGFWYRLDFGSQLSATVRLTGMTYGSGFQSIVNVWDGNSPYAIEARFFINASTTYKTFGTDDIEIDGAVAADKIYFNSPDPLVGAYVDPGALPNTTASTAINAVYVWTGAAFTSVGTITDGTNGMANPGWVTWARPPYSTLTPQPTQFQNAQYYSYWYYFTVSETLSADVRIAITTMPYFDIAELGVGQCNAAWKDRAVYSFTQYPAYGYISAAKSPLMLNGDDYGIIVAGDGRAHKWACALKFYNELLVWQEEKGVQGGTLTLFEGYSPTTFGKLVLSTKLGTFSAKSACVVDGVLTSTATDEQIKTLAFFISHWGVCATDGRTVVVISDDIQDYFDPTQSNCIRRGYEKDCWIFHDTAYNVLRCALVTGSTATTPNTFPVFDLTDKTWSFDSHAYNFSCMTEVQGTSGDIDILQYAGGVDNGTVYRSNVNTHDYHSAVNAYADMEIDGQGEELVLKQVIPRVKVQSSGGVSMTIYKNSRSVFTKSLSMTAEVSGDVIRRHIIRPNIVGNHMTLRFQEAGISGELYLQDLGLELLKWQGR
uniref:Uncharacterized protein n=1 Tax=viral metagenome TaxID=1070528 RepID=A0A6M3K267_9ZZZZ